MSGNTQVAKTNPSELSYSDALQELERIVSELDDGVADVDTLGEKFKRAIDIVEDLDARIVRTREQVEQLTPRLERFRKDSSTNSSTNGEPD